MANCKICGKPVVAGPVMHSECLEQLVTEVVDQFCDYCICPYTCASMGQLHREYCRVCPVAQLMKKLGK